MNDPIDSLSEKEKDTLRLVVRGHDAKSMARALDLSVHTINDRLRAARRKMQVTSSREAARILFQKERGTPENSGPKDLGGAEPDMTAENSEVPATGRRKTITFLLALSGVIAMFTIIAAFALSTHPAPVSGDVQTASDMSTSMEDRAAIAAASDWLALVDEGNWETSFAAAGIAFRDVNTAAIWADASRQVRGPLGALISREAVSVRYLNAPPRGFQEVVFHARYANKADVIETVTLQKEDGLWKPVGVLSE